MRHVHKSTSSRWWSVSKFWETGVNICLRNGLGQGGMGGRVVSEMRAINPGFKIVLLWIFREFMMAVVRLITIAKGRGQVCLPKRIDHWLPRLELESPRKQVSDIVNVTAFCLKHLCLPPLCLEHCLTNSRCSRSKSGKTQPSLQREVIKKSAGPPSARARQSEYDKNKRNTAHSWMLNSTTDQQLSACCRQSD